MQEVTEHLSPDIIISEGLTATTVGGRMTSNLWQSGKKIGKQEIVGKKYFLAEKDCKSSYPLHLKGILGEQMLCVCKRYLR